MLPNNSVLNALASLCEKLEMDSRLPPPKQEEARELYLEHRDLVERHHSGAIQANQLQRIEAQAEYLGISMIDLVDQVLQTRP